WTLDQMAADVSALAEVLSLSRYGVLGHSYGAFVALSHAVSYPGAAEKTIVSSGVPSSRYLSRVEENLKSFEPVELREQVVASWAREQSATTAEEVAALIHEQWPFHFADPLSPKIAEYEARSAATIYNPAVLRHFAKQEYGGIEVEARLGAVR